MRYRVGMNRLRCPWLFVFLMGLVGCSPESDSASTVSSAGVTAGVGGSSSNSGAGSGGGASCDDGVQNGSEIGVDCGGGCPACAEPCTGADCDKVTQAVSKEAFAAIFEMLSPSGSCSSWCVQASDIAGNCTMYRKAGAEAFYEAAKSYPDFLTSDDPTTNKMEVAALFSNVIQESGLQEWGTPWQMGSWPPFAVNAGAITMMLEPSQLDFSTAPEGNPRIAKGLCYSLENGAAADSWLGRGPIQLTGESNYAQASFGMSMYNDLTCQAAVDQNLSVQNPPVRHTTCSDKNRSPPMRSSHSGRRFGFGRTCRCHL